MAKYRANGKFLLSGEYLVLQGARALALPLKLGHSLEVKTIDIQEGMIHWDAYTPRGFWFASIFSKHDFTVHASDDMDKADNLSRIFKAIKSLNPNILQDKKRLFLHHETGVRQPVGTRQQLDIDFVVGTMGQRESLRAFEAHHGWLRIRHCLCNSLKTNNLSSQKRLSRR